MHTKQNGNAPVKQLQSFTFQATKPADDPVPQSVQLDVDASVSSSVIPGVYVGLFADAAGLAVLVVLYALRESRRFFAAALIY